MVEGKVIFNDIQFAEVLYLCKKTGAAMTTIIIDEKTVGAKKMVEYLKTQRYAKIIDERAPSASLLKSIEEAKAGKTNEYKSAEDLFTKLRK